MYEFWFLNLRDPQDHSGASTFSHHGTTYDFLELCCQIAEKLSPGFAGEFVNELLTAKLSKLAYLRVIDWNFELEVGDQTIRVVKTPR